MSEHRVFLSYSTEDRPLVPSALKWLRESEFQPARVDDPANWHVGGKVRSLIADRVRQADTVVVVWSDRAAKSAWVQYEVGMAQACGVPIRVLLERGSRAKLPPGLAQTAVIKIESAQLESDANTAAPHSKVLVSANKAGRKRITATTKRRQSVSSKPFVPSADRPSKLP